MKIKHIPLFIAWIDLMLSLDNRLDASDFKYLYKVFLNGIKQ